MKLNTMTHQNMSMSGLSQLSDLDGVSIRQKITGFTGNKYVVLSPIGEVVMYAREDMGAIGQILGGHSRPFHIDVFDTQDRKVSMDIIFYPFYVLLLGTGIL